MKQSIRASYFEIFGSLASKIERWGRQTERHPNLAVYLRPPTEAIDQPWEGWTPQIAIDVVSSSQRRDYKERPADYISAGVREYWIFDPRKRTGRFLVRRVDVWAENRVRARGKWKTALLPGFTLNLSKVFAKMPISTRK